MSFSDAPYQPSRETYDADYFSPEKAIACNMPDEIFLEMFGRIHDANASSLETKVVLNAAIGYSHFIVA